MSLITWTFPHGHVRDGRVSRFAGTAYEGRIEVEMVGSAPDGWSALLYWRGSPLPAVTLSISGPSVVPLQNAMQVVVERLMRAEGADGVIEDADNARLTAALAARGLVDGEAK